MKQVRDAALALMLVNLLAFTGGCARQQTVVQKEAPVVSQPETQQISADPAWFSCKADTDCQVVEGLCQSNTAVNINFTEAFFTYRDKMNPTLECAVQDLPPPAEAACYEQRCALKTEQVSRAGKSF